MRTCTVAFLALFSVTFASCGGSAPLPRAGKDAAAETGGSDGAIGSDTASDASDVSTAGVAGSVPPDGAADDDAATDTTGAAGATVLGRSAGCGRTPATGDTVGMLVAHTVTVTGLADAYQKGGAFAQTSGSFDFSNRPYAVRLPAGYDPTKAHSISFEGSGCGFDAAMFGEDPESTFVLDPQHTGIEVALAYVTNCFADGGPIIGNRDDSPEVPYFRAVLADVEAQFCVDETRVFVAGQSSGAWETQLIGCAAADVVRGIATLGGGLRDARPACEGPVAAFLVASTNDPNAPLGPVPASDPWHVANGSSGIVPERDEVLKRNGCVGTDTETWNAAFPMCMRFTGCPATAPVVWCPIASPLQAPRSAGGVLYAPGPMWQFLSTLP